MMSGREYAVAPVVSVIMPVSNGERFIGAAIGSVLSQSLVVWELIVVDDGSTDDSADIARRHAETDPRLRVLRQENRGLAAARNRGLSEAAGSLVAFLDCDDVWEPGYLQAMVARLAQAPEALLAFAGWRYIGERGEPLPQAVIPFGADPQRARCELPWRNALLPSAVVARTSAVRRLGGFDTTLRACEDWDLWIRLRREGAFVALPDVLVLYRVHDASMTENVEEIERGRMQVNEKHHGSTSSTVSQWPESLRRAVGETLFVSALAQFRRGENVIGSSKVRDALAIWPALVEDDEFHYELACANQARGVRGTPSGLDLAGNARLVRSLLPLPGGRRSWGRACLALAQVALLARDQRAARRYALRALVWSGRRWKGKALAVTVAAALPATLSCRIGGWRTPRVGGQPL
jgi:glycosyltransferase involved in cell wall biosynthesis